MRRSDWLVLHKVYRVSIVGVHETLWRDIVP